LTLTIRETSKKEKTAFERRRQIANAAVHLFLKKGVANTSMRDLAAEVGMTTGGVYHFFRSKKDIIHLVAEDAVSYHFTVKDFRQTLGDMKPSQIFRLCAQYWLTIDKVSQDHAIFIDRETLLIEPDVRVQFLNAVRALILYFEELLTDGIQAGEFRVENITLTAFNVVMLRTQYAMRRWFLKNIMSPEDYAKQQTDAIMKQILVSKKGRDS